MPNAPRTSPAAQAAASGPAAAGRFGRARARRRRPPRADPEEFSRANARSSADWKRFPGCFSRQRATTAESAGGTPSDASGGGSFRRMAVIVSAAVAARNGFLPASSS